MKIKNFINVKIGDKSIDFHNLILDEYLKRFVVAQLDIEKNEYSRYGKALRMAYIKFDTPLTFDATSEIDAYDSFDAIILNLEFFNQSITERQIEVKYVFDTNEGLINIRTNQVENVSNFYGRKITAIGFNRMFGHSALAGNVCSILDTSNYNLYLQENENFVLTRRDLITTDASFWCSDTRVEGPVHLTVSGGPSLLYQDPLYETDEWGISSFVEPDPTYAQLYSVGFSSYKDSIAEEYVIGTDITAVNNGTSISINGLENTLSDYLIYPNPEIHPNSLIYPLKANYKYIVYKYKIYQTIYTRNPAYIEGGDEPEFIGTWTDTGVYYLQSVPLSEVGNIDLTIKYERSN